MKEISVDFKTILSALIGPFPTPKFLEDFLRLLLELIEERIVDSFSGGTYLFTDS